MIKRIKEYLEYRRNKKLIKKEFTKIATTTLSTFRIISDKGNDILRFITKLTEESKNIEGEALIKLILDEVSTVLQTDNNRIIEILTYIASLKPEDIQKILTHSIIETSSTKNNK